MLEISKNATKYQDFYKIVDVKSVVLSCSGVCAQAIKPNPVQ
jgi:hypothetical protein